MYCPQCATQNIEAAKFCRVCGANLEAVSLALATNQFLSTREAANDRSVRNEPDWLAKEGAGKRNVVQGSILLAVSLLIAFIGLVVSRGGFAWFPIWAVFFGWMAGWGTISLAFGLGRLIEAKAISRRGSLPSRTTASLQADSRETLARASVTEHTTRHLEERNL